jgi:hypothetical protein
MKETIAALAATRRDTGSRAARLKLRLIAAGARRARMPLRSVRRWHDELLFCAAYPQSPALRRAVERELARQGSLVAGRPMEALGPLAGSGIAGTSIKASFSQALLHWLVEHSSPDVSVVWDEDDDEALAELLPLLGLEPEADGLLDPALTTEQWVRRAASPGRSPLEWLLQRLDALGLPPAVTDQLATAHGLTVRWRLTRHSRTLTRFPSRPIFYQRTPLLRDVMLGAVLRRSLPRPVRLRSSEVTGLIDTARGVLAARARETDPITYANPSEVTLFRLERGVDIALFGLAPSHRLPIETYVGFVAARNRIPVAYGGGWVFFDRCEIGVNLFEEFRGGESAWIFAQVLRTYRQWFRVAQFLVPPYQFGQDNTEAIRSGAFWFYRRLGFRPTDARIHRLADAEFALLRQSKHRTSPRVLRRLAGSPMFLDVAQVERGLSPPASSGWQPTAPDLAKVGSALSAWLGRQFNGDREAAARECRRRVVGVLGAPRTIDGSATEREWFGKFAPLIAALPDLEAWPERDRRALRQLMLTKGGSRERDYALRLQVLPRLRKAFEALSATSPSPRTRRPDPRS